MADIKRSWDHLSKDRRQVVIREIASYFKTERDIELGMIASEEILDFFLQTIGKDIYNKAIDNSKAAIKQNFENLEIDVDLLWQK